MAKHKLGNFLVGFTVVGLVCFQSAPVVAQEEISAGASWTSSYGFPSAGDRAVRLQFMTTQRQLESGAFDAGAVYNYTYNNTYDHSVGDLTIDAADGATVEVDNRTADGTGTNTYTVGAVNTTTITVDGRGNVLDISSYADSDGCQDGSINMSMTETVGGIDISAAGASGSGASAVSSGSYSCN